MGVHHIALATKDIRATHRFYTDAMGFSLAKVEAMKTPGGFAKHLFYDTGGDREGLIAFWDLQDALLAEDAWSADISRGLGLPPGVNHLAFTAADLSDLERRRNRWLAHGHDVREVDHGWCTSIYTVDPNGITVEFCTITRDLTEADARRALELLEDPNPPLAEGFGSETLWSASDYRGE